jgi:hypothetical protein
LAYWQFNLQNSKELEKGEEKFHPWPVANLKTRKGGRKMTWKKVGYVNCGMILFIIGFGPLCVNHWWTHAIGYGLVFGGLGWALSIVFGTKLQPAIVRLRLSLGR